MYRRWLIGIGFSSIGAAVLLLPPLVQSLRGALHWVDSYVLWTVSSLLALGGAGFLLYARRVAGEPSGDLRAALRRGSRGLLVTLGALATLLTLLTMEATFRVIASVNDVEGVVQDGTYLNEFFDDDPLFGYRAVPGTQVTSIKRIGVQTIYDVVYTIDPDGHRVIPLRSPERPETTVVFFGGSNTFGEGVNDDETLPYFFAAGAPDTATYNYGFCGYGPQQMLAQLEDGRIDRLIDEQQTIGIYLFIDAHVQRAVGSMVVVTSWGYDMPHYVLDDMGRPLLKGSFRTGRSPGTNWLYALASRSQTLRHFNVDLPVLRESHYGLTARILEAAARRMAAVAKNSRLVVVLHPTAKNGQRLVDALDPAVVQVLDYSGTWGSADPKFVIEGDWHPTPLAHRTLAEMLLRDVLK